MAKKTLLFVILTVCALTASAQSFPLWEHILKHYSGKTDDTAVPTMKMGHMQMSLKGEPAPGDEARSTEILNAAAGVLVKYRDVKTAVHDGYKPFYPTGRIGEEIHYTNYRYHRFDYDRPTSILYKRTAQGLQAVGVMYTAPANATPEQLNAIAPLSIATWPFAVALKHCRLQSSSDRTPDSERKAVSTPKRNAPRLKDCGFPWSS